LSQIQPSDITGPPVVQSPYFGGRKSGGTKRKRGGGEKKQAGEKKLTKRGKWLGKKSTKESSSKKVPFSASRTSTGSSFNGSPAGYRANPGPSTSRVGQGGGGRVGQGGGGAMGLLAPPRPRSVKRE